MTKSGPTAEWLPRVLGAGFKYWAIVLPAGAIGKLNMRRLASQHASHGHREPHRNDASPRVRAAQGAIKRLDPTTPSSWSRRCSTGWKPLSPRPDSCGCRGPTFRGPSVHVIGERDVVVGSGGPLRRSDAPVLIERRRTDDRRRIDSLRPVEVVGASVRRDGAHRRSARRSPAAPAIDDVVFDERARGPAIEGEVGVAAARRPDPCVVADDFAR